MPLTNLPCGLGDGDVMMRILPSLLAVEAMRAGVPPQQAAQEVGVVKTFTG